MQSSIIRAPPLGLPSLIYLFTGASFSSKDAPVGAVRSAEAWQRARDLRAGAGPRVVPSRPEGLADRGEAPGCPEQASCGRAFLLLEGRSRQRAADGMASLALAAMTCAGIVGAWTRAHAAAVKLANSHGSDLDIL